MKAPDPTAGGTRAPALGEYSEDTRAAVAAAWRTARAAAPGAPGAARAARAAGSDGITGPSGSPNPNVHERVERRLRRAGALFGQLAQILGALADDVGEVQLAARPDPRLMSSVEPPLEVPPVEPAQEAVRPLLGVPELAAVLGVDVATVRRWRRDGRLPAAIEIGNTIRWRPEDIDAWLVDRRGTAS